MPVASWDELANELGALGFDVSALPIGSDPKSDAEAQDGQVRGIADDLDLLRFYAGWTSLDGSVFARGGLFSCADHEVFCSTEPADLGSRDIVLGALRTNGHISFGGRRDAAFMLLFDRPDHENAPAGADLAGGDLAIIVSLDKEAVVGVEYQSGGDYVRVDPMARVRIVSDTAVFVVALDPQLQATVRFVGLEHSYHCTSSAGDVTCVPPTNADAVRIDMAPADAPYAIDMTLGTPSP